jgi:hypothetical protein
MHSPSDEKFFVNCPKCREAFDHALAEPVFYSPVHKSDLYFALCSECTATFEAASLSEKKKIASACFINVKNGIATQRCGCHPWAMICGITISFNFGDFQAALRHGHELPREIYIEILEGRADFIRFPGGVVVSYALDESD